MTSLRRSVRSVGFALLLAALLSSCGGSDDDDDDGNAAVQPVPAEIQAILDKPAYRNAVWALRVTDVETGRVVHDVNSSRQMLIGSLRKLFTIGLALEAIGPEHRFRTPVYRVGAVNGAGVLAGNLVIVASGDIAMGGRTNPDGSLAISNEDHNEANTLGNATLTAPDPLAGFTALAAKVAASGIRRVEGDVIVDDRLFEAFDFREEFKVGPMFVNDNVVDVAIDAPASVVRVDSRPKSAAFGVRSDLVLGPEGSALDISLVPELSACIGQAGCIGTVSGTLPAGYVPPLTGRYPLVRTFRIVQPSTYARTVFIEALQRAGVAVAAPAVAPNPVRALPPRDAYDPATRVAELVSHPYKDHARFVSKVSYNIGSETSLMLFGLTRGQRTIEGALATQLRTLVEDYGIAADSVHFVDGSGGGETTASSVAVTRLLSQMRLRPSYGVFRDAQPRLGIDGSLSFVTDFQADPTLAGATGKVHGKTGTYVTGGPDGRPVLSAQGLAGYIEARSGRLLAFSLVVNNVGTISGIEQILPVFQDEGTISALLWKLH